MTAGRALTRAENLAPLGTGGPGGVLSTSGEVFGGVFGAGGEADRFGSSSITITSTGSTASELSPGMSDSILSSAILSSSTTLSLRLPGLPPPALVLYSAE